MPAHDHAESRGDDAHTQLIDVRRASTCAVVERCLSGTRSPPPQARSTRPEAGRQVSRRGRQPARAASAPRHFFQSGTPPASRGGASGIRRLKNISGHSL